MREGLEELGRERRQVALVAHILERHHHVDELRLALLVVELAGDGLEGGVGQLFRWE